MRKLFTPLVVLTAAMFAYAPIAIANAPFESTMFLVQKIFYFHLATWMALGVAISVCAVGSAHLSLQGQRAKRIVSPSPRPNWRSSSAPSA